MKGRAFPLILFLSAFLCRLLVLAQLSDYPLLNQFGSDPAYYYQKAIAILTSGNWLGDKIFFASPFYHYFLAVVFVCFGVNFFAVRMIQFVLGSFTAVLLYLIGLRAFDRKTGILAGIFYCLYWIFPFYELTLEYDPLLIFFVLLAIYFSFTLN